MNQDMKRQIAIGFAVVVACITGLWLVWKMTLQSQGSQAISKEVYNLQVTEKDWIKGNSKAKTTIVEYSDFQCPACKAYAPVVEELIKQHSDIRLVYRHFPLIEIHKNAEVAAHAAEAAGLQNKFFEMHDVLFDNQEDWGTSKSPQKMFDGYAKDLGLDVKKFQKDFASDEVKNKVQAQALSGNAFGIRGTPSFFIDGHLVQSTASVEGFIEQIKQVQKLQNK